MLLLWHKKSLSASIPSFDPYAMSKLPRIVSLVIYALCLPVQAWNQCYYADGSHAQYMSQCGTQPYCCMSGDPCQSNGLCRDINNHLDGSLTYLNGNLNQGSNYTGLYQIEGCVNKDRTGCLTQCLTSMRAQHFTITALADFDQIPRTQSTFGLAMSS